MREVEIIGELKKHLRADNFEMFCHEYNKSEDSLVQYHDSLIIDCLETTNLPLGKKVYFNIKKYVHFLVEKSPTLQLVCLMIAQKEDASQYISYFNSLDHLLFLLAARDANCTDMLKHLDIKDDTLVKLLLKSDFKKGIEWLQTYKCKNTKLFCTTVIATFFEMLNANFENNEKDYDKCTNFLYSKGFDKKLTQQIIKIHVEEIRQEREKIALAIIANQTTKITILKKRPGFWTDNIANIKRGYFYTPFNIQIYLMQSSQQDLAQKIYNFINLSKVLPDMEHVTKRSKI